MPNDECATHGIAPWYTCAEFIRGNECRKHDPRWPEFEKRKGDNASEQVSTDDTSSIIEQIPLYDEVAEEKYRSTA